MWPVRESEKQTERQKKNEIRNTFGEKRRDTQSKEEERPNKNKKQAELEFFGE